MKAKRMYRIKTATKTSMRDHRRRGASYVFFLGTVTLVAVIGYSALMATRIQRRSAEVTSDSTAARLYAVSAVELGLAAIHLDPAWRDNWGIGAWITDQPISTGTLSLEVVVLDDGGGDDENPDNDPVVLIGTGVKGRARQRIKVTLVAISDNGGMVISPGSWERTAEDGSEDD